MSGTRSTGETTSITMASAAVDAAYDSTATGSVSVSMTSTAPPKARRRSWRRSARMRSGATLTTRAGWGRGLLPGGWGTVPWRRRAGVGYGDEQRGCARTHRRRTCRRDGLGPPFSWAAPRPPGVGHGETGWLRAGGRVGAGQARHRSRLRLRRASSQWAREGGLKASQRIIALRSAEEGGPSPDPTRAYAGLPSRHSARRRRGAGPGRLPHGQSGLPLGLSRLPLSSAH